MTPNMNMEELIEKQRAEIESLRAFVRDCRDHLLFPLATEGGPFSAIAEGLGQGTAIFRLED
jgi:hypothetical protein